MSNTARSRQEHKSIEGELMYELQNSYELSPKLSEQIVISAKRHLVREQMLREGQIEVTVVEIEERSGKVMEKMGKRRVRLTIDSGIEDAEAFRELGRRGLRQMRSNKTEY